MSNDEQGFLSVGAAVTLGLGSEARGGSVIPSRARSAGASAATG